MPELSTHQNGLSEYVHKVNERVHGAIRGESFRADQRELMSACWERFQMQTAGASYAQPLGLLYLVLRAWGQPPDSRAECIGAACSLYLLSGDLFDDVQDEDLDGKPCALVGPGIATNTALALLFLAFDQLRQGLDKEPNAQTKSELFAAFSRVSLLAVGAQHADLMGAAATCTPAEVTQRDAGKTSSVALFMECGALLSGCSPEQVEAYRNLGLTLAAFAQIIDDVRDIYGKDFSPDLATEKWTYPVACLFESASREQWAQFVTLRGQKPQPLSEIRELLYDCGAVERCALAAEALRQEFFAQIRALGNTHAAQRLLCQVVDSLASTLYEPEPCPQMDGFWTATGPFACAVRATVDRICATLSELATSAAPRLQAWPWPHYLYAPEQNVIYFPDIDELPSDVLPFHAELWGLSDLASARALMFELLPFAVAHELVHSWRHAVGRLSDDSWHEEHVANRVAVAYVQQHEPAALEHLERCLASRGDTGHLEELMRLVATAARYQGSRGYELDLPTAAQVHIAMLAEFCAETRDLAAEVQAWLEPGAPRRVQATSRGTSALDVAAA
jgi:geranylgeranyl pyrophosphate synthase